MVAHDVDGAVEAMREHLEVAADAWSDLSAPAAK
jgi:DNA-binding FadR family transcriptional regulator